MRKPENTWKEEDSRTTPHEELSRVGLRNWRSIALSKFSILGAERMSIVRLNSLCKRRAVHTHSGCLEAILCLRGENLKCLHCGVEDTLRPGEVFVAFPDEPHCIVNGPKGRFTYSLLFRLDNPEGAFGFSGKEFKYLVGGIRSRPTRIFAVSSSLAGLYQAVVKICDDSSMNKTERTIRLRHVLDAILLELSEASARGVRAVRTRDAEVCAIVSQMERNPVVEYSLDALCKSRDMSKSGFIARFKYHTGLTPHAFLLKCRVDLAKKKMKKGRNLTSVAQELGFSSLTHFTTVFRSIEGMSPREWLTL